MNPNALKQEITFICKGAIGLNIAAYCISIPVSGIMFSFAVGLLLGTAVMLLRLLLLYRSVVKAANEALQSGTYHNKRHMVNYLLRMLLFAVTFGAAYLIAPIAAFGIAIPMLYPRLLYTADAIFQKPHREIK